MKEKIILVTIKMKRGPEYNNLVICLKEGVNWVGKLDKNWVDKESIARVINFNEITKEKILKKLKVRFIILES